jgi:hypothetical protein
MEMGGLAGVHVQPAAAGRVAVDLDPGGNTGRGLPGRVGRLDGDLVVDCGLDAFGGERASHLRERLAGRDPRVREQGDARQTQVPSPITGLRQRSGTEHEVASRLHSTRAPSA